MSRLAVLARTKARLRGARQRARIAQCFWYDSVRFARWSSASRRPRDGVQLAALMDIDTHRIEKGLSMPETRPGFGRDVVRRLAGMILVYRERGLDPEPSERAASALRAYLRFHEERGLMEPWMADLEDPSTPRAPVSAELQCGIDVVSRSDVASSIPDGMDQFFISRRSVRHFAAGKVTDDEVTHSIALAIRTPSVCNRQSWRVHDFASDETVADVLALQNGNRGFGQEIARVLVITTDLRAFTKPGERFQCWIDGGMFAMSLVYALHSLGLGTCTLNCSHEWRHDKKLHEAADIPPNEAVIMMIGVGRLPETYKAARSPRRSPDDITVKHG